MQKKIKLTQQRLKIEKHNGFTEKISKIAVSLNDDNRIQSIGSVETYLHGPSTDLVSKKEQTKRSNVLQHYKNV